MSYRQGKTKPLPGIQVNWGHPLANGLIGCWHMNEGSGNRIYDATHKYGHGSLIATTGLPKMGIERAGLRSRLHGRPNAQYVEIAHNPAYPLSIGSNGGFVEKKNELT